MIKNRGAGKIESRRVLAGRGRNTLQRRPVPEELGDGPTRTGDFTGSSKNKGTLSGSIDGKNGNALETHGTSNGTHGDVGKVDMCVLNPASRNPGWKWGRGSVEREFEQLRGFSRDRNNKKSSNRGVAEFWRPTKGVDCNKDHLGVKGSSWGKKDDGGASWSEKADANKDVGGSLGAKWEALLGMIRTSSGYYFMQMRNHHYRRCLHQCITSSEKDACARDPRGRGRTLASPSVTRGVTRYLPSS
ncbi:hypothetical protein F2Q69_00033179 [Brassica cretica]|uniref:Uncharacterized protein n=1 Tax=Brassica cretica TaxID=69181 RepID=A0A8S9SG40_BRACR|nr:hypothetical protein F2Q69_00033179 [Brassica cretica]